MTQKKLAKYISLLLDSGISTNTIALITWTSNNTINRILNGDDIKENTLTKVESKIGARTDTILAGWILANKK